MPPTIHRQIFPSVWPSACKSGWQLWQWIQAYPEVIYHETKSTQCNCTILSAIMVICEAVCHPRLRLDGPVWHGLCTETDWHDHRHAFQFLSQEALAHAIEAVLGRCVVHNTTADRVPHARPCGLAVLQRSCTHARWLHLHAHRSSTLPQATCRQQTAFQSLHSAVCTFAGSCVASCGQMIPTASIALIRPRPYSRAADTLM